ncbi:MAG TPA: DMT family transporter [Thermomicrobiales bacterium]|jgi:drug/metabolite transporter (DMT)-like permease
MTRERLGILLCLSAAVAYSTQPIFAKFAYAAAVGVVPLLIARYFVSASIFWTIVRWGALPLPPRSIAIRIFFLGFLGTSVQVFLFATALTRLDAALGSLLLYCYPTLVAAGAILSGQERPNGRLLLALLIASSGLVLVLGGAGGGGWDTIGVLCALGSALGAAIYLLVSHRFLANVQPLSVAALGESGAGLAFLIAGVATSQFAFGFAYSGWWPVLGLAVVSSVALITSLAGMVRVGPTTTGIVMMAETPLTVIIAYLVLGERLSPPQLAGGVLVIAAVILLQFGPPAPAREVVRREREVIETAPPAPL